MEGFWLQNFSFLDDELDVLWVFFYFVGEVKGGGYEKVGVCMVDFDVGVELFEVDLSSCQCLLMYIEVFGKMVEFYGWRCCQLFMILMMI